MGVCCSSGPVELEPWQQVWLMDWSIIRYIIYWTAQRFLLVWGRILGRATRHFIFQQSFMSQMDPSSVFPHKSDWSTQRPAARRCVALQHISFCTSSPTDTVVSSKWMTEYFNAFHSPKQRQKLSCAVKVKTDVRKQIHRSWIKLQLPLRHRLKSFCVFVSPG